MATLLFAPVTWNIAETTRMLEIAKVCRAQFNFDCHFMGYGGDFIHLITDAGFAYHPQQPQLTPQRIQELWKADRGERGGKMFTYTVIAPIKAHLQGADTAVPANVHVFDWLPAHKVNPLAKVAVIHGGEGTVQTACASGKPFVGIGLQPEQEWNIEFLVRQGTAVRLPKYGVTHDQLHQAIEHLRLDPQVRQRAAEIQTLMASWPGAVNADQFLANKIEV